MKLADISRKKKENLEAKMRKKKLTVRFEILWTCTDIIHFKKGLHPRTNTVQNEKCDLITESNSILTWLRKYSNQLFIVYVFGDVMQTYIQ